MLMSMNGSSIFLNKYFNKRSFDDEDVVLNSSKEFSGILFEMSYIASGDRR
jgi:hypothetical protein